MPPSAPDSQSSEQRQRPVVLRPTAPIVPAGNISGRALILVIAIMSFLSCLTVGITTMVVATAESWQSQISREVTIQIKPAEGLDMDAALQQVRSAVMAVPGVTTATIVDRAATERLLAPWLGDGFDIDTLPVPRLVILSVGGETAPDYERLRQVLADTVPEAVLDDHRTWTDRLVAMARTMSLFGFLILGLMLAATALTVIFATRGVMAGNRHIIEVLHFVGAETGFIAGQFQRRFFLIGLKGAAIGGGAATLLFAALAIWQTFTRATPLNDQATALFGQFLLPAGGYLGIALVILIIAAMTTLTSRYTVMRAVREIDRLRADPSLVGIS
ncbi:ABC transporter permease [Pseudohoeflea sp. DP4N28-3]|uniref:ABC transporter permease n=1 Tax=Pseudohoeflea coraliihabitans TaxID=2860393 RepID=A0ABS6WM76_9HYPH|nr:ABC transporter permease [Pseudohoeflea sp. DP4N28-3]